MVVPEIVCLFLDTVESHFESRWESEPFQTAPLLITDFKTALLGSGVPFNSQATTGMKLVVLYNVKKRIYPLSTAMAFTFVVSV